MEATMKVVPSSRNSPIAPVIRRLDRRIRYWLRGRRLTTASFPIPWPWAAEHLHHFGDGLPRRGDGGLESFEIFRAHAHHSLVENGDFGGSHCCLTYELGPWPSEQCSRTIDHGKIGIR